MEIENQPSLVKCIIAEDGSKRIVCTSNGTKCCQDIHNNCAKCPVMQKIINKLNTYETIIAETGNTEYTPLTTKDDCGNIICSLRSPNIYSAVIGMLYTIEEVLNE